MDSSRINRDNGVFDDADIFINSFKVPDSVLPDGTYAMRYIFSKDDVKMNKSGTVVVGYMSLENGQIDSFKIVKSLLPSLDSFAVEVVKFMPDIILYSVNNKPVKAYHERSILFTDEFQRFKMPKEFNKIKPLIDKKDFSSAIELILPLSRKYPYNMDLLAILAMCYYEIGNKILSYRYYRQVYDLGSVYGFTKVNSKEKLLNIMDNEFKSE